jgi:hypothetical protein
MLEVAPSSSSLPFFIYLHGADIKPPSERGEFIVAPEYFIEFRFFFPHSSLPPSVWWSDVSEGKNNEFTVLSFNLP